MMLLSIGFGNDEHAHEMLLREVEVNYTLFFRPHIIYLSSFLLVNVDRFLMNVLSVRSILPQYTVRRVKPPPYDPNHGLDGRVFYILGSPCRHICCFRKKRSTFESYQHSI